MSRRGQRVVNVPAYLLHATAWRETSLVVQVFAREHGVVVVDKRGDIAILRTLGASSLQIMGIFMVQGGLIGLIGTGVGVIVGVLLALGVTDFVLWLERLLHIQFLQADVYPISYLPSSIHWPDVIQVAVTALAICLCASLYPAWRASRVQPAEALRYE